MVLSHTFFAVHIDVKRLIKIMKLAKTILFILAASQLIAFTLTSVTVEVNKSVDSINISFTNPHSSSSDWVGIYTADTNVKSQLKDPLFWLYTCGTKTCSSRKSQGQRIRQDKSIMK